LYTLRKILGLNIVAEKNMVGKEDPGNGDSSTKISYLAKSKDTLQFKNILKKKAIKKLLIIFGQTKKKLLIIASPIFTFTSYYVSQSIRQTFVTKG